MDVNKEIVFASSDKNASKMISYRESKGDLKLIAPKLYTSNLKDTPESIVRRNLLEILAWRMPGCVISHKSALLLRPTEKGNIYITYSFSKRIADYPGVILNVMKGHAYLDSDIRLGASDIYASSESRWMLEVMEPARRGKDGDIKSFSQKEIETRLETMIKSGGEEAINRFRDNTRIIAEELSMQNEFQKLNSIISALLSTHKSSVLSTPQGLSRAAGVPMDGSRIQLFESLYDALNARYFPECPDENKTEEAFRMFSFFESYFSNYIEGTRFDVGEAKEIVDSGIPSIKRPADSHDILGTFKIVSNRQEMNRTPTDEDEFISSLRYRHSIMLEGRPDCTPGIFKTQKNRAGNTEFVSPELVEGTLRFGFKYYRNLRDPFAKAIYMMFLCSETHPFNDGNGRVSRIMMNAELVSQNQTRIIVPTVFREDYILSLRRLSRGLDPLPFITVMEKLQSFSKNLWGADFNELNDYLQATNAYEEPDEAKLKILERLGRESK